MIQGTVIYIETPNEIPFRPHGIKVRIDDGTIGYIKEIIDTAEMTLEDMRNMIQRGESEMVDFKETFRVDISTGEKLDCLRDAVVKTIASFMNSKGGTVLIGVDDSGNIIGLERDYGFVSKQREKQSIQDKFQQEIRGYVNAQLSNSIAQFDYQIRFATIDEVEICIISVKQSTNLVFVKQKIQYVKCNAKQSTKGVKQILYVRSQEESKELDADNIPDFLKDKHISQHI